MTEPTTERYPYDARTRADIVDPSEGPLRGTVFWTCNVPECAQEPVRGTEHRPYGSGTCTDHPRNPLRPLVDSA